MSKSRITENIKKYTSEFVLIFISVILAFAMTEWSNSRGEKLSEDKLLTEIRNGINKDLEDFTNNINGNRLSLRSVAVMRDWLNQKEVPQDSIAVYYSILFRNYAPIINKSGYESLKSTNLKTITNDSLRSEIITLYDYHYKILETLENDAEEMQEFKNFYKPINSLLFPYMEFSEEGRLLKLKPALGLTENQKKEIMSYLWQIEFHRKFKLLRYEDVMKAIRKLDKNISQNLE